MNLSIIIVSWNTRELLRQCLESVYANPPDGEFEVWVVDNASADSSVVMVREQFPEVKLIENTENHGFARANNQGIRASAGKFVLLLNSDTRVHTGSLKKLVSYLEDHSWAAMAGVRLLNVDGSLQYYPTTVPTLWNQTSILCYFPWRERLLKESSDSNIPCRVERVKGAVLAVRRDVLERIGLMEESLFLYAEEDDLCQRATLAGLQVYFLPDVFVTHYGGASTQQLGGRELIHLYRGKIWFIRKYSGKWQARLFKGILGANYIARGVLGLFKMSSRHSARSLGAAYLELLRQLPKL